MNTVKYANLLLLLLLFLLYSINQANNNLNTIKPLYVQIHELIK
jgi:hypothetical protein